MIVRLLIRLAINVVALLAAVWLIPGVDFVGDRWWMFIIVAIIFGLVNALIRPIVMVFSCPLLILTLGLFTLAVNAIMLGTDVGDVSRITPTMIVGRETIEQLN